MRCWLVVMLLLSTGVANSQQQKEERTFPAKDQVQLLLTQSERAFDAYEQVLKLETQVGGDLARTVTKDRGSLTAARALLARLKERPEGFNGPVGFLLVGNLDDGTRDMSVCMGQAGVQSGIQALAGNASEGQRYVGLAQACGDASTLLYTVSETAFNMYSQFLLAQDEMTTKAASSLERCVNILKENQQQRQ